MTKGPPRFRHCNVLSGASLVALMLHPLLLLLIAAVAVVIVAKLAFAARNSNTHLSLSLLRSLFLGINFGANGRKGGVTFGLRGLPSMTETVRPKSGMDINFSPHYLPWE